MRRRNSVTRLVENVVDDPRDLVDVVYQGKDVARDGRKTIHRVAPEMASVTAPNGS